jgi:hypothetical protein
VLCHENRGATDRRDIHLLQRRPGPCPAVLRSFGNLQLQWLHDLCCCETLDCMFFLLLLGAFPGRPCSMVRGGCCCTSTSASFASENRGESRSPSSLTIEVRLISTTRRAKGRSSPVARKISGHSIAADEMLDEIVVPYSCSAESKAIACGL